MSDSLRDRIAAALSRHRPRWGEWVTCTCDNDFSRFTPDTYEWHVAEAVIAELGLRRERTDPDQIIGHGYPPLYRYVTDWKAADAD